MAGNQEKKSLFAQQAEKEIEKEKENTQIKPMSHLRLLLISIISIAFLAMQLYIALVRPLPSQISYSFHLACSIMLVFLYKPLADKFPTKKALWIIDGAVVIFAAFVAVYFISNLDRLIYRIMMVDPILPVDLIVSFGLLIVLLESIRRTLGYPLVLFILVFVLYAALGQHLTGPLRYSGMTIGQFSEMLTMSPDGIFGSPLGTCVTAIFYFLIFGTFFATCGGGAVLIDCGMKLSNKSAGGPAKASVVSSSLMGMVSGSAIANVSTTGVLTIPLMKSAGYTPEQAAAVEAVSSTGGQLMPPIMGVSAFIMAEMINVSYAHIAVAAIIPALAYYGAAFLLVHFIAKKNKLGGKDAGTIYKSEPVLPRLYRLIPIFVLVALIFLGKSLTTSALWGTLLSIVVGSLSKETRLSAKALISCGLEGVKQAANIAIPTAACGIMIGIVVRSGAANKLTTIITSVGGSNLFFALIITMLGCLLLGMALPTVAAYLVAYIMFGSTLIKLGVPLLPANMFIFYFGVIAQITPPVCLASYTAAGIAGGKAWKTGWTAFTYAFVAFLIPFVFVYQPAVLLMGTVSQIVYAVFIIAVGVFLLAGGISGYLFATIERMWVRALLIMSAIMVIMPGSFTDAFGMVLGAVLFFLLFVKAKKEKGLKVAI